MTVEDFTTYTEIDPNSRIALVGTNHIDATVSRNEDAYLYKDRGASHFGDFEHLIDVKINNTTQVLNLFMCWALTNDVDDMAALRAAGKTTIYVTLLRLSTNVYYIVLQEDYATTPYFTIYTCSPNTWYYLKITKSGTTFKCYIYSNAARTTLLATLSLTLQANHTFRYNWAVNTFNDALTVRADSDIENLDLQEPPAVPEAGEFGIGKTALVLTL